MILESIFRGNLSAVDLVCPTDPEYKQLSQVDMVQEEIIPLLCFHSLNGL